MGTLHSKDTQYQLRSRYNNKKVILNHSHQDKENEGMTRFMHKNAHNKKLVNFIEKTRDRLSSLNQMRSQLDTLKINKDWYESMKTMPKNRSKIGDINKTCMPSIEHLSEDCDESLDETQKIKKV